MERHGLRLPIAALASNATGRLSPLAFLVGVEEDARVATTPPPGAPKELAARDGVSRSARSLVPAMIPLAAACGA